MTITATPIRLIPGAVLRSRIPPTRSFPAGAKCDKIGANRGRPELRKQTGAILAPHFVAIESPCHYGSDVVNANRIRST